jgi:hypothetical protein
VKSIIHILQITHMDAPSAAAVNNFIKFC